MYITACKEEMIKQLPQSSKGELDQLEHSIKSKKRELEQVKNDLQVRADDVPWMLGFCFHVIQQGAYFT